MRFGIDEWWPPQPGDIIYHDWGDSGGTLLKVTEVYDPLLKSIDDCAIACAVMHDHAGPFGALLGGTTLILGATLQMTKGDMIKLGRRVILISRISKI